MKIAIHAVGRMKAGPERELFDRYAERFSRGGASMGLDFTGVTEIAESRAQLASDRMREEGDALIAFAGSDAALVLLDERGKALSSVQFAGRIGAMRDEGVRTIIFALGGADGHDARLRARSSLIWSFGAMTWPHQLARIMLAEQLYRATTILAGHPYHRA